MTHSARKPKQERMNLRTTSHQKEVIKRAASLRQTDVSSFMLSSAYEAAQEVLAQQTHFALADEQWNAFCSALDAPPKEIPALKALFSQPSVFEQMP